MRTSLGLLVALVLVATACVEDTRPRGDGSITVDSGRDTRVGDSRVDAGDYGYCPGYEPSEDVCRVDTDCECGSCNLGSICGGAGCASECGSDGDCTDGWCSDNGCCSFCVPSCPETACTAGTRCDTTTGRCNLIPCDDPDEPTECATNYRCVDGGCRRIDCETNADCDCGTCAQGRCYDRPGQCCPPLPG